MIDKLLRWLRLRRRRGVPTEYEQQVADAWYHSEGILVELGVPLWRLKRQRWHEFSWHPSNGPMPCKEGRPANGCYKTRGREVHWNVYTPRVLTHELGHARSHALGYNWWKAVGH